MMKNKFLLALAVCALAFTGCGTVKSLFTKREVVTVRPAQTNNIVTVATNWTATTNAVTVLATNAAGVVTAATQPQVILTAQIITNVTSVVTPAVTVTNITLADGAAASVQTAGRVASNFGIPFADAAGAALVAVGGVIFGFLNRRKARAALTAADAATEAHSATKNALATAEDVGLALVANIEQIRTAALKVPGYAEHDATVMKGVQLLQQTMGVKPAVEKLVAENTGNTTRPA